MHGERPAKRTTKVMTNSYKLNKTFARAQCHDDRRHVSLAKFRASPCQQCIEEFCGEACKVVREEVPKGIEDTRCNAPSQSLTGLHQESKGCFDFLLFGPNEVSFRHPPPMMNPRVINIFAMELDSTTMCTANLLKGIEL